MIYTTRARIAKQHGISLKQCHNRFRGPSGLWRNHPRAIKRDTVLCYDKDESDAFFHALLREEAEAIDKKCAAHEKRAKPKVFEWSDEMKLIIMFHKTGVRYRTEYLEAHKNPHKTGKKPAEKKE